MKVKFWHFVDEWINHRLLMRHLDLLFCVPGVFRASQWVCLKFEDVVNPGWDSNE